MLTGTPAYTCPQDGTHAATTALTWCCPACRGPWDLEFETAGPLPLNSLTGQVNSLGRYEQALPLSTPTTTLGEGTAVPRPPRARAVLAAVRESGGTFLTVTKDQIRAAQRDLAVRGFYVETTGVAWWAAVGGRTDRSVVVPLCGAGLKTGLVPRQATFARKGAASGACSRRAGWKPSYWTYSGFRPVRRERVPGGATGERRLPQR